MRKALIVGINYYTQIRGLYGCVNDARAVTNALERQGDGTINFAVNLVTAESDNDAVSRSSLKDLVRDLFAEDNEVALLYFAGHGHVEQTGGYLCSSDCSRGDDGLSLGEVMTLANASPAKNKIICLDSCHSGIAGTPAGHQAAEVAEGVTILTASTRGRLEGCRSQPGRRHYARCRVCAHRSIARSMGAAAGLQDQREGIRVAQARDRADFTGMAASPHRILPEARDEVSSRSKL
jgi:hypothetical protein